MATDRERTYRVRLGQAIVQLRALNGQMTAATLSERISRSEAALSRWENGKATPSAYDLVRLAEVLGAPADLLLDPPAIAISPVAKLLEERAGARVRRGLARGASTLGDERGA